MSERDLEEAAAAVVLGDQDGKGEEEGEEQQQRQQQQQSPKKKTVSFATACENNNSDDDDDEEIGGRGKTSIEVIQEAVDPAPDRGDNNSNKNKQDDDDDPSFLPTVCTMKDHFSLSFPTSIVRYRGRHAAARVIPETASQYVLEEERTATSAESEQHQQHQPCGNERQRQQKQPASVVSIRKVPDSSSGQSLLRMTYGVVTFFWTGFLFVFFVQVLLFLMMNLVTEANVTSVEPTAGAGAVVGVVLAFPVFIIGLSSALVIAGAFVVDTARGHFLIRNFTFRKWSPVVVEWLFFLMFLGLPVLVLSCTMLAGLDDFWTVTLLFWLACVSLFYLVFTLSVVYYELRACWEISHNYFPEDRGDVSLLSFVRRCILLRQTMNYSGRKRITYLATGTSSKDETSDVGGDVGGGDGDGGIGVSGDHDAVDGSVSQKMGCLAKCSAWKQLESWGLYEAVDPPKRIYSVEHARDFRQYVTSHTWSLEKIFCRPRGSRFIAIVNGPGALTADQMRSSFVCTLLGTLLIIFFILSGLLYLQLGGAVAGVVVVVAVIVATPSMIQTYRQYKAWKKFSSHVASRQEVRESIKKEKREKRERMQKSYYGQSPEVLRQAESAALYLVSDEYRISRAKPVLCWIMFGVELVLFYLYPFAALWTVRNYPLAVLFLVVSVFTLCRYYINPSLVLKETGSLHWVDRGVSDRDTWRKQSRLDEIVSYVTASRSRGIWMAVLSAVGIIFLAFFVLAIASDIVNPSSSLEPNEAGDTLTWTYLPDFYYPQEEDTVRYPTCELSDDLAGRITPIRDMADFAFLSGVAYNDNNVTEFALESWFGSSTNATLQEGVVVDYRRNFSVTAAVSFKLITLPVNSTTEYGYVTIRGTQNAWDMFTNAQLWLPAIFMQALREILPLGGIWTPAISHLIAAISTVASSSIERVSFYKATSGFVKYLQGKNLYGGVIVTGHSLGGGLAIITGAQTGVPAIALSGPNAMLSRRSFEPKVTPEQLDSKTFNIIPERDIVPMFDDRAENFQQIRCTEPVQPNVIACHSSSRSLCEILYTCGTRGRPALCECVTEFGYKEPQSNGTRTFAEACAGAGQV